MTATPPQGCTVVGCSITTIAQHRTFSKCAGLISFLSLVSFILVMLSSMTLQVIRTDRLIYVYRLTWTLEISTLNITKSAECHGCDIDVHNFDLQWYPQVYTHVAATIVKFVNNATNVTKTSTISGRNFTLPSSAAGDDASVVFDSVITTHIGGTLYTLWELSLIIVILCIYLFFRTYPNRYRGIDGIEIYSHSLITIGNGTDRTVKCVESKTILTHAFLEHADISNALELSAFIDRDIDHGCNEYGASPPGVLVRVSSLTATTTNFVGGTEDKTSAASKASPSVPLSPPNVPQTSSTRPNNRPTVLGSQPPRNTVNAPSTATGSTPAEPASSELVDSVSSTATPLRPDASKGNENSDVGPISSSGLLVPVSHQEASKKSPTSQPSAPIPTVLILGTSIQSASPQPFVAAGLTFTPSQPEPSQEPKNLASLVGSDLTISPTNPNPTPSTLDIGSVQPESEPLVIGGLTFHPIIPSPASISPSLQNSMIQERPKPVAPVPTAFSIAGTTISRGGHGLTVSGTFISVGPSDLIIGAHTIPLASVSAPASPLITPNPAGYSVAGTFITPGAIITVSGTLVSLGSSNLVIGTQTIPLPSAPASPVFSLGGETFTANPTGFLIHGTTILPNRPGITVSGTRLFLGSSGLVIGTQTIPLPPALPSSVFSLGGETFTANPTGFPIHGTPILPNSPAVTIFGTPVSLGSSGLVLGTSTIAIPPSPSILAINSHAFTAIPSGFSIGGTAIYQNGSPITISGTSISLGASVLVVGSSTIALPSSASILTINGQTLTAIPSGFSIGGTAIYQNGSPITISGTSISLGASVLVVGSSTIALPSSASILTINGQTLTAIPSGFSIAGTAIHPGSPPVTISGTPISLGASALIIGSSTVPLSSATEGVGSAILSGLGIAVSPSSSSSSLTGPGNGNGSLPFTGAQTRVEAPGILGLVTLWLGVLIGVGAVMSGWCWWLMSVMTFPIPLLDPRLNSRRTQQKPSNSLPFLVWSSARL